MNRQQLRTIGIVLLAIFANLQSAAVGSDSAVRLPPFTNYCDMLAQEIQGRKHAFLAGNLTYYIGGQYNCWRHFEDETIGLTHPFYHDLRGRGHGLAEHAGSGYGHDFRGWEFYKNTKVAYGTAIIGDQSFPYPVPTSMQWQPDKVVCTYEVGGVKILEEKFIAANDVACSIIVSDAPISLRFDGHSLIIPKLSIDDNSKVRFDEDNNALHIAEGGRVTTYPVENETCTGQLIYDGMSTILSCSATISSFESHTDSEGRQAYSFHVPCDNRGMAITWAMGDEYATALAASRSVLADYCGALAAKTKAMNDLLNYQIPYFRCPDHDIVNVYYYLWAIYLMYYIDVGQGWEVHPHTQTAVNNFLGMHRYDANFQIKVGAWTTDKDYYAYGNVLHWKPLLPYAHRGGALPDNKGIAWYSPVWGATTEHWALDAKQGFFWEIPLSTGALEDHDQISDVFTSTPDTNYYAIQGMYNCHIGRNANVCALAHLKRYNMHWGIPIAPEAWSKQPAPWGDQYSNFNAGKILLILEGMAGLDYSIPKSTLNVCDNMPEEWSFMELRIPIRVGGATQWPRVLYRREENGNTVRKTVSVSGNPLTHLKIQPWLEEGAVLTAPNGYTTRNQGRNHIGYHFQSKPNVSLTIKIRK